MHLAKTLFVAVILAVLSLPVLATDITTFSDITDLAGSYTLTADVTLPEDFAPIGAKDAPFTGTFDGAGFAVTGSYTSLFGYTDGASIQNVCVTGATITGSEVSGGIVGTALGETTVQACSYTGNIAVTSSLLSSNIGGIVGILGKAACVTDCTAELTVWALKVPYSLNLGGICARNEGTVAQCKVSGMLTGKSTQYMLSLGGIVGENRGKLEGCVNTAALTCTLDSEAVYAAVGGIAGYNNAGTLERCSNAGVLSFTGTTMYPIYGGGLVGINRNGSIHLAKNTADITADNSFVGGIVGLNFGYKAAAGIDNAFNTGSLSGKDSLLAGLAANNTVVEHKDSAAEVSSSLNISDVSGVGKSHAALSNVYTTGTDNGLSKVVSQDELKTNGIPVLEGVVEEWVANTDISALPDLLLVRDTQTPELIASSASETADKRAYYLFTPEAGTDAKVFYALYYDGSRYLGSSAVTAEPQVGFTRLTALNIPENATKIRFIAFASALSEEVRPAGVAAAEVSLVDPGSPKELLKGKSIVCIGDSLTEGDYGSEPAGTMNLHAENYPYFLAELTGANVTNAGRCGYSAELYYNNKLSNVALSEQTDIVLIMLGTNNGLTDTIAADTNADAYTAYAETQTGYYARIIETCIEKTAGQAQIILMTPPVTTRRDRTELETTVSVVKKLGEEYSLPVIDNYNGCGITYENIDVYMPIDQLHCGYEGYQLLATYIAGRTAEIYKAFKPESYALSYKTIDAPVGYMGRWFDKTVDDEVCKATFSQGAEFYFRVSGTSRVWLNLASTASPAPVLAVSVDGSVPKRMTTVGVGKMLLAENLTPGEHTFRVIVDGFYEYQEKWTSGMGFVLRSPEVEEGGSIMGLVPTNPVILYYGDSITEGINVLGTGSTPDSNSATGEYPFVVSHALGAVSYTNGFGASGVTRGGSGGVPKCLDVIDTLYSGVPLTDTTLPAAIVVNHGHNDPTDDSDSFKQAYTEVLARLREKYPNVPIFAVSPFAGMHNTEIQAVVSSLKDDNLFFIDKPTFSYTKSDGAHPDKSGARAIGLYLAKQISARVELAENALNP